jgi:hypothetical protein
MAQTLCPSPNPKRTSHKGLNRGGAPIILIHAIYIYTQTYTHTQTDIHTNKHACTRTQTYTERQVSYLIWFGHIIMCLHSGKGVALLAWCWELENKVVIATDRFGFGPWNEKRHNIMANQERENVIIMTCLTFWHRSFKLNSNKSPT